MASKDKLVYGLAALEITIEAKNAPDEVLEKLEEKALALFNQKLLREWQTVICIVKTPDPKNRKKTGPMVTKVVKRFLYKAPCKSLSDKQRLVWVPRSLAGKWKNRIHSGPGTFVIETKQGKTWKRSGDLKVTEKAKSKIWSGVVGAEYKWRVVKVAR